MDKIYDKAWKLIASPDRWEQGFTGHTRGGACCDANDDDAAKWCLIGALFKVYGKDQGYDIMLDLNSVYVGGIAHWNDHPARKHSEVVEFLKERNL